MALLPPAWITPAGSLGTIPEGSFYSLQLLTSGTLPIKYTIISGSLPNGIALYPDGVISGVPVTQKSSIISKFAIRISNSVSFVDRTFTMTINGDLPPEFITPSGLIADYFTGSFVSSNPGQLYPNPVGDGLGYQIEFTQPDSSTITKVAGSLPPGCSVSPSGLITGFILPTGNLIWYSVYTFTLEVTNERYSSLRTFSIAIYNRACLTADTTIITADNTWLTADESSLFPPIITTTPGLIGSTRVGDFFAYQFSAFNISGEPYEFFVQTAPGQRAPSDLIMDPSSGWLYGRIAEIDLYTQTFTFGVYAENISGPITTPGPVVYFQIQVVNEYTPIITWISPANLGSIDNGSTSLFKVAAVSNDLQPLTYKLSAGVEPTLDVPTPTPGVLTRLPQGLVLLPSGDISGRVSFETFCLDGNKTTFDVSPIEGISDPTTFDLTYNFYVNAYLLNGELVSTKEFTITVNRVYNTPYQNLYIQAMPPLGSRHIVSSILSNETVFPPDRLFRPDDPFFGLAPNVTYWHCYGLHASTLEAYLEAMRINHYDKQLTLGTIKTARALDSAGDVIYEVVYSEVIDNLVNNDGITINKSTVLPYPIRPNNTLIVYPNGLDNMRDQVVDSLGQESKVLPLWMMSPQDDGSILGFTPAWVIAYTKPYQSGQVAYDLQQYINEYNIELNLINFEADRYEIDRTLDLYWDISTQSWEPPASVTTFDAYYRPAGLVPAGRVDRASFIGYTDVQGQTFSHINNIGGIDGEIDGSINGKKIIFIYQEPVERMGIYLVTVVGNRLSLSLVQNTVPNNYVFINTGDSFNNAQVYHPSAPVSPQIVITWTGIPINPVTATTFDQNSTLFIDPQIQYTDTVNNVNDAYVLFPRRYIIPVPVE